MGYIAFRVTVRLRSLVRHRYRFAQSMLSARAGDADAAAAPVLSALAAEDALQQTTVVFLRRLRDGWVLCRGLRILRRNTALVCKRGKGEKGTHDDLHLPVPRIHDVCGGLRLLRHMILHHLAIWRLYVLHATPAVLRDRRRHVRRRRGAVVASLARRGRRVAVG